MSDEKLFQPLRIGNLALPNRVVMTTVKLGYSNQQGGVTERHIAFYARRARGGAALITSEPLFVQYNGREMPTQLGVYDNALTPGLRRLTDAVHADGGLIMAHINHAGRAANPNLVPTEERISASDVLCPANQVTPNPLTRDGIADFTNFSLRIPTTGPTSMVGRSKIGFVLVTRYSSLYGKRWATLSPSWCV
jgi:2,4-dienoyl-CoA reductase-like NADH-dependent reductase (Old Yellow Enzyme family)